MINNALATLAVLAAFVAGASISLAQHSQAEGQAGGNTGLEDLENLLRETDSALSGKGRPASKKSTSKTPKTPAARHQRAPGARTPQEVGKDSSSSQQPATAKEAKLPEIHTPLSDQERHTLAVLDGMALKHELNMARPKQRAQVSLASMSLHSHYLLEKDDDKFRAHRGERLQGAYISYIPNIWRSFVGVSDWSADVPSTKSSPALIEHGLDLDITTGFFVGDLETQRSGVENGEFQYSYTVVPVDIGLSYRFQYRSWGVAALWGVGFEYVRQDGSGQFDTISDFFRGDIAGLSLSYHFTDRLYVVTSVRQHGVVAGFGNDDSRGGYANRVFAFGLGLPLSS